VTDQDNSGLPPSPWLRRLRTVGGVRRELCRVYGEARDGTLDPQDATRLTHVLVAITRLIEGSELEQQIAISALASMRWTPSTSAGAGAPTDTGVPSFDSDRRRPRLPT
jgi:hypothetical protein